MTDHARRSLPKATFVSVRPSDEDRRSGAIDKRQRGLEKIAFVTALRASSAEVADARRAHSDEDVKIGLAAISSTLGSTSRSRSGWKVIARTPAKALAAAGRALATERQATRERLQKVAGGLVAANEQHLRNEAELAAGTTPPPSPCSPGHWQPHTRSSPATVVRATDAESSEDEGMGPLMDPPADNPWKPDPLRDPRMMAPVLKSTLGAALSWARVAQPESADELVTTARRLIGADQGTNVGLSVIDWDRVAETVVETGEAAEDWTNDLVDGFEERMSVEPVGRVHLERLDMTPVGVIRGELLHSLGLAPKETVTLIHREWSSRESSFEKLVSDEFEQSTEDGVTENTELASATETQSRHSSEMSMEATASASYVFASASASIGYGSGAEDETAKRDSRNHAISVTRKASSRTRKEHKTTFTIKEQAGVEDQSVRTLSNSSDTEPMRIDFHQLLRKWKVDLFRYGVRLTYDLVVPAPGIDLLTNLDELRRIDHELARPFAFSLTPAAITRANWLDLAARHGAEVEAPPPDRVMLRQQMFFGNPTEEERKRTRFESFEFDVPDGYTVARGEFMAVFSLDPDGWFDVYDDPPGAVVRRGPLANQDPLSYRSGLENLRGRAGKVAAVMGTRGLRHGFAQATLEVAPTADAWRSWQHAAWTAIRRAAEERWQASRQELRQRRDQLGAEIGAWDPLSLRKMEREEIMKTTLKWIFGPAFDLMPGEVARHYSQGGVAALEPSRLTAAQWAQAMGFGEFIKFLQQAIEWENVLFFVYPYFWDNPRNHALKRFLNHPDSLHRAFLRGGAARVVLTVRPGFEESFTRLFETGSLDDELAADHPYLTIAQELRAYAATHYPGIPSNNEDPDALDAAERGQRIAQWNEYTPISALDITVNTPLDQLT
jgi:hypothetical protein